MDLSKLLASTPVPPLLAPLPPASQSSNPSQEYSLPTPMADFQKELSDSIVSLHYSDILKYFETDEDDSLLTDSLSKLFLNIQLISVHPYLLIDHFMPKSLLAKDIPLKLTQTSGKFRALKAVLDVLLGVQIFRQTLRLRLKDALPDSTKKTNQTLVAAAKRSFAQETVPPPHKNVLIVARSGRTLDLIELLLLGMKTTYIRHSGSYVKAGNRDRDVSSLISSNPPDLKRKMPSYTVSLSSPKSLLAPSSFGLSPIFGLTVHMVAPDDLELLDRVLEHHRGLFFDLVIPFDLTADNETLSDLRTRNRSRGNGVAAPLLRLVPVYTVEHIAQRFAYKTSDGHNEAFRNTISAVVVERGKVGQLDPSLRSVYANNLEFLAPWLLQEPGKDELVPWPLAPIAPIPIYAPQDVERSLLTEVKYVPEDDYSDFEEDDKKRVNDKLEFEDFEQFKKEYLKTPNDRFYETKRLNSRYMANPIQLRNKSNIIGIEAESICVAGENSKGDGYYDHLMKELILTHFEVYELNLKYLQYGTVSADATVSKALNTQHLLDFESSLTELDRFLTEDLELRDKYAKLCKRKQQVEAILNENRVEKLEKALSERKAKAIDDVHYKSWEEKQLKIIQLVENKHRSKRKLEVRENERGYLKEELEKLEKFYGENITSIQQKKEEAQRLQRELDEFTKEYDLLKNPEAEGKKRKMNTMISEVDGLMLGLKQLIDTQEEQGTSKSRARHRRG